MKQTQKIGHQSQELDVKEVKEKSQVHQEPIATMKVDEKPSVTNDRGFPVDKHSTDAGKGYNEEKLTDSGSDHLVADPHDSEMANVPFEEEEEDGPRQKHPREEQDKHEEEDHFRKRTKQAEDVRG